MGRVKWIFYTDLFGQQRWEKQDDAGRTLAESSTGFPTLKEAAEDASHAGCTPADDCQACEMEWQCCAVEKDHEPV